jgi:hypothetical protein
LPKSDVDKRLIERDEDLRRRTRWALNFVGADRGIRNVDFADALGVSHGAISSYRVMKTSPKTAFIKNFCAIYGFHEEWLLKGLGEPFPGACAKYPEVCGHSTTEGRTAPSFEPPGHPVAVMMPAESYEAQGIDPAIQAMADIRDIFASGDPILVPAIQANLNAFKRALQRERQFAQVIEENKLLRERIVKLEGLCNDLRKELELLKEEHNNIHAENKELRKEVNRLRVTYENPEGGAGSLTDIGS